MNLRKWHKDIDFWESYLPSVIFTSFKVILLSIFWDLILFVNSFGSKWSFSKFFVFYKRSHCPIVLGPTNSSGVNLNFGATTFMKNEKLRDIQNQFIDKLLWVSQLFIKFHFHKTILTWGNSCSTSGHGLCYHLCQSFRFRCFFSWSFSFWYRFYK